MSNDSSSQSQISNLLTSHQMTMTDVIDWGFIYYLMYNLIISIASSLLFSSFFLLLFLLSSCCVLFVVCLFRD